MAQSDPISAPPPGTSQSGTRIAHVGIAVRGLAETLPFYRDVLGLPEVPLDNADGAAIAAVAAGDALVELLEPHDPNGPISRFLEKRGPGLHHICFAVDDLAAALARCRSIGVRLIDETPRIGIRGSRVAFLHPACTGGVLTEIVQPAAEGH